MAISEATIRQVKYPPELLPDAWFGTVPAGAEFAPPILDLKRFPPYIVMLTNIQLTGGVLGIPVNLRARYDSVRVEYNAAAMLTYLDGATLVRALVGAWQLPAKDILYFNFFGIAGGAYTTHFGVWAYPPTVADKLFWGTKLNAKEQAINQELGISNTVEKGLLPMPISSLIEREYRVVGEETHTVSVTIAAPNIVYPIEIIYTKPNEFLVLTRVAASPGAIGNNVQFIVDRDNDANYLQFPTFPLSLVAGGEISCFIPALTQLRLTTSAAGIAGPHLFRYTIQRVKLNNILRVRFGLITEADATSEPLKELYKKVMGGIV